MQASFLARVPLFQWQALSRVALLGRTPEVQRDLP
jgi:hypothetical protein